MNKFAVIIALTAVLVGLVAISSVSGNQFGKKPHKEEQFEHEGGELDKPRHHPHNQVEHGRPRAHHGKPAVPHHYRPKKPSHPRHPKKPHYHHQPQCTKSNTVNQAQQASVQGGESEQAGEPEEQGQDAGRGGRPGSFKSAGGFKKEEQSEQGGESEEQGQEVGEQGSEQVGESEQAGESEQGGESEEQVQEAGRGARSGSNKGAGGFKKEEQSEQGGESEEQGQEIGRGRRRGSFKGAGGFGGFKKEDEFNANVRADAKHRNRNQFQKNKGVFAGNQKQFGAGVSSNDNNSVEGFHRQKNVNNDRLVVKETNRGNDDTDAFRKQSGHSQEGHFGGSDNKFFGAQAGESGSSEQDSEKDFGAGVHKKSSVGGFGGAGVVKGQF